ncbi:hypothetical protein [Sphingomonas nostoxanthinifaciens]|uniref:hypothetical protein n=1 Tax=Sphingomonas nostoxanthinifaciens TaxID=2872652 RepID=UPI001CC1FFC3|nr:hypothetical protein [Sphingomonas nostoxanthinifaciens]UAK24581.1 hypothetical protein K8P63_20160 [Sphingomonas nostoxanthinifaciens]
MRALIALTLLPLAAPAFAAGRHDPEARLARVIGDRQPGAPVQCININPTTNSTTIDGVGIVYESGATAYLNRFDRGCPQLTSDSIIITRQPTGQLCRGDIADIQTSSPPSLPKGSCAFDAFVPYSKVKAK